MADLPNCPLCGLPVRADPDDYTAGWVCSDWDCPLPTCSLAALRALAALRKPMTEQEADGLVEKHYLAAYNANGWGRYKYEREADEVGAKIRAALTGKLNGEAGK